MIIYRRKLVQAALYSYLIFSNMDYKEHGKHMLALCQLIILMAIHDAKE